MSTLKLAKLWFHRSANPRKEALAGALSALATGAVWAFVLLLSGVTFRLLQEVFRHSVSIRSGLPGTAYPWMVQYFGRLSQGKGAQNYAFISADISSIYIALIILGTAFLALPLLILWRNRCQVEPLRFHNFLAGIKYSGSTTGQSLRFTLIFSSAYTLVGMALGSLIYHSTLGLWDGFTIMQRPLTRSRIGAPLWFELTLWAAGLTLALLWTTRYTLRVLGQAKFESLFSSISSRSDFFWSNTRRLNLLRRYPKSTAVLLGVPVLFVLVSGITFFFGSHLPSPIYRFYRTVQDTLAAILSAVSTPIVALLLLAVLLGFFWFFWLVVPTLFIRLIGWLAALFPSPSLLIAGRMVQRNARRFWIMLFPLTTMLSLYYMLIATGYTSQLFSHYYAITSIEEPWNELTRQVILEDVKTGVLLASIVLPIATISSIILECWKLHLDRERVLRALWAVGMSAKRLFHVELLALAISLGATMLLFVWSIVTLMMVTPDESIKLPTDSDTIAQINYPTLLESASQVFTSPWAWVLPLLCFAGLIGTYMLISHVRIRRALLPLWQAADADIDAR